MRRGSDFIRLIRNPAQIRVAAYKAVINWGTTENLPAHWQKILNKPTAVALAINKIAAFGKLKENNVNVPSYWTTKEAIPKARRDIIFARTTITGSGGDGIRVCRPESALPEAPLYVQYIRKTEEYRAHVVGEGVIFIQQKRAKAGVDRTADQNLIRCHGNGFVFAENEVVFAAGMQDLVKEQAIKAVKALGLDFGAVDLVVGKDKKVYVLEVNTAPGLESTALIAAYSAAFKGVAV